MAGHVEQRVDLGDLHALGTRRDLHDLVAGFDLSLLEDAEVEAGSAMGDQQCGHLRLVHADADAVAGDTRLRHFEQSTTDPVMIADAHRIIGKSFNGEVLAELPIDEVAAAEPVLPIAVRADLIDKNGPMLPAVPGQIALPVTLDVQPPHHPPTLNGSLPDRGMDRPSLPRDVARQTHIDRK